MTIFGASFVVSPLIKYALIAAPVALVTWWLTDTYHDAKYNRYKAKVVEATLEAQREVLRVETVISTVGLQAVARHQSRSNTVNQSTEKALNEIIALPTIASCDLPIGVRDAINTARGSAASAIDDSYRPENGMLKTSPDGRNPREPRPPRN